MRQKRLESHTERPWRPSDYSGRASPTRPRTRSRSRNQRTVTKTRNHTKESGRSGEKVTVHVGQYQFPHCVLKTLTEEIILLKTKKQPTFGPTPNISKAASRLPLVTCSARSTEDPARWGGPQGCKSGGRAVRPRGEHHQPRD